MIWFVRAEKVGILCTQSFDIGIEDLNKLLLLDNDNEQASDHHRYSIIELFRAYIAEDEKRIRDRTPLHNAAIYHYWKLYTERVEEILKEGLKQINIIVDVVDEQE